MVSNLRRELDLQRKERTKNTLMGAASIVFREKGYHRALVTDIVKHAEVGQGTFYRHFKDKRTIFEALFDHLITSLMEDFSEMQMKLPETYEAYIEGSRQAVERFAGSCIENRDLLLLFLTDGPTIDEAFADRIEEVINGFAAIAAYILEHAIQAGFARPCDSAIVSQFLVGITLRLIHQKSNVDKAQLAKVLAEVIDFSFFGFGK